MPKFLQPIYQLFLVERKRKLCNFVYVKNINMKLFLKKRLTARIATKSNIRYLFEFICYSSENEVCISVAAFRW